MHFVSADTEQNIQKNWFSKVFDFFKQVLGLNKEETVIEEPSLDNKIKEEINVESNEEETKLEKEQKLVQTINITDEQENDIVIPDNIEPQPIEEEEVDEEESNLNTNEVNSDIETEYEKNLRLFEEQKKLRSLYYTEREKRILASQSGESTDPPYATDFNPSCGDGICASYENECECEKDCGSCEEGYFCTLYYTCELFVPDTCLNRVCESGEVENCHWDCPESWMNSEEEEEEILSEEEQNEVDERIRNNREEFFRNAGYSEEEIQRLLDEIDNQNESEEETVAEEVEEE